MTAENNRYNSEAVTRAAVICGSVPKLAAKMGINQNSIYRWLSHKSRPTPLNCIKIEKVTNGQVKREDILPDYPWDDLK